MKRLLLAALLLPTVASAQGIDDAKWSEIAGSHASDTYEVQKGDTLWDVSKRLFGNPYYWPKIWSLNNDNALTNPHIMSPGQKLVFKPGTAESMPQIQAPSETPSNEPKLADAKPKTTKTDAEAEHTPEYEKVGQDLWKPLELKVEEKKQDYDEYGLEKELRVHSAAKLSLRVPIIANETTLPYLGEIVGSRRDGVGLSQNEVIFIKSENQDLQVGTTYTALSEPQYISESKSDRSAYVYRANGEVRIVGVKDSMYIGIITKGYDVIRRGDKLYPLLPVITDIKPIAATDTIEALVMLNPLVSSWSTAQYSFIHLDRGLEDGVQVGNVFRVFEYYDPSTKEKLTDSDILVNGDAIIVHATGQFSTAMVISSRGTIKNTDFGVMLKDVSTVEKRMKDQFGRDFAPKDGSSSKEDPELDELDALDHASDDGLGKKEEQEVRELEKWDRSKDKNEELDPDKIIAPEPEPAPAPAPEAAAPPAAEPTPPPAVEPAPAPSAPSPAPSAPTDTSVTPEMQPADSGDPQLDSGK